MTSINCDSYIGKQIGNYTLEDVLGRGRFACVYLAKHNGLGYYVAIKLLDPQYLKSSPQYLKSSIEEDFRREALILQKLKHPHILSFRDFGESEGTLYIIAEYASQGTLREHITGDPRVTEEAVTILTQVGEAVHTTHEHDIVHCDLKPENILFNEDDDAILADFGIAIQLSPDSNFTTISPIQGTYLYMAPEQFEGLVSKKSDQYSLGCIAYELFTGSHPFSHITPFEPDDHALMKKRHKNERPRKPKELINDFPKHIEDATLKALAKEPGERHSSVDAFIQALQPPITSSAAINSYGGQPPVWDPAQALLDLQLPTKKFPVFRRLLSLLGRLGFTIDVGEAKNQYTSERRRYTRVKNNAGQHRALVHIPDSILYNPNPANQSAITSMGFTFNPDSLVIIFLEQSEYPPFAIKQIVEELWSKRGQVRGKFVPLVDVKKLLSDKPTDQQDWVAKILELQNTLSMSEMSPDDIEALAQIIGNLPQVVDPQEGWRLLFQGADLGSIAGDFDFHGAPVPVARNVLNQLKTRSRLPREPDCEVMGLLLCYILTMEDLPPDKRDRIEEIRSKYALLPLSRNCKSTHLKGID